MQKCPKRLNFASDGRFIMKRILLFFRNQEKQEELWRFSLACLKDYLTEEEVKDLEKT